MKRNFHEPRVLHLQSSVGVCGVNYADDVKALQELMMKAGYQTATGRSLKVDGICNNETKEAIIWYQRLLTLSRSGLVQPLDQWFIEALKNASQPEWHPRITSGPLHVREAQFTFDNEGTDYITVTDPFRPHPYPWFSRILHWPHSAASGVTLGRGYDMGNRSAGEIFATLRQAGIEEYKAILASKAAFLKGREAASFVKFYGPLFGEITHQQQIRLFEIAIQFYISRAKRVFNKNKAKMAYAISWENMRPALRDIFIDSLYQGCKSADEFARLILLDDLESVRTYLKTDGAQLKSYGRNLKRLRYINDL
ncbi:peptidoglycan-binding protein [Cronobacter sakazakii]|uniref:peptidoglycan-binding protein n=1 Tax=Cronobacter sakazakii TaxID=28141 RepID=UPI000CFC40DC|nr:peptidoglycan-binding protein [Cronobacter sakazakii]EKM1385886.1 peptidoglycan-binding protein [Cronobacter sakazakii]EKM6428301.1 peptidoglycan-binding protein [Cronobacter sakazakii]ELY7521375.1 peptidoglycan-binding protein [Cronobacter sakazakii]ELZ1659417.1 peptidoglycan-binding protein [Cronobacter sakazakii]UWT87559.1 peptidoglycan-binding protein [Cronobacter sakazakii]